MSTRRAPLASNPNAVNSPYRAAAPASKQKRSYAHIQREDAYGQPPPAKKQMLDSHTSRTPPRVVREPYPEARVLTRKSYTQFSLFERRAAPSNRNAVQTVKKSEKTTEQDLESIRQWQKHYRKQFPSFVFFFESVPEDQRGKYIKQVMTLGAREEKFFSNAVTHVVTNRQIPARDNSFTNASDSTSQTNQPQTINPSLLDRTSESTNQQHEVSAREKFTFDAPINRRPPPQGHEGDVRRQNGRGMDLLVKAQRLGMKLWALEKFQRMMTTMFDTQTGDHAAGPNTRSQSASNSIPRSARETDLSKLLRDERINGPSDRDPTVATKELINFKGPFIYIHDIDDKQKPIMVREYGKVVNKEAGDWPQFRSVSNGKCPFVGEIDYDQRQAEKEKERIYLQRQREKEQGIVPRTRAAAAVEASKMYPPQMSAAKRLFGVETASNRQAIVPENQIDPFAPAKFPSVRRLEREPSSMGNQNAFISRAGTGRLFGGEPVASGIQPNITSAIRSQISSTAAQPGARVGTNKEFYGLQRKVLEKNSGGPGSYGVASSRLTDAMSARDDAGVQPVRRKSQHALALIDEDFGPSVVGDRARTVVTRQAKAEQQQKVVKRDAKLGYCENCQDKFEDFDEHVVTNKHRKFAEKQDNWKDLDSLLNKLERLPRGVNEDQY